MTASPTTTPAAVYVTACAMDRRCPGDMLLNGAPAAVCTVNTEHVVAIEDLAACTRCDSHLHDDRVTVSRALSEDGWAMLPGGGLVCPDHAGLCKACDENVPQEALCQHGLCDGCQDHQPCDDCLRETADEQAYDLARDGWGDD